jgi:hypothetical protein
MPGPAPPGSGPNDRPDPRQWLNNVLTLGRLSLGVGGFQVSKLTVTGGGCRVVAALLAHAELAS